MKKIKLAILISGSGSNLQALINACRLPEFPAEICCVISNTSSAYGLARAQAAAIPTFVVDHKDFADRISFDESMHDIITAYGAEIVCLAGFMRLITPWFIDVWHNRLLNIHPSLLPSFKGLHAQQQALDAGVKIAGCTVHFVRSEMDSGPIIIQAAVPVLADDNAETLAARILVEEHRIYPAAIAMIANKMLTISGDRVTITGTSSDSTALINPKLE
jgi:phosphoribosylglycinamide formyltransferase-1